MISKYSCQQFTLDFVLAEENSYDLTLKHVISLIELVICQTLTV